MKKYSLVILLMLISSATYGFIDMNPVTPVHDDMYAFSYEVLFKNLPEILGEFKWISLAIAFVILTSSLVFALRNATTGEAYVRSIVTTGLFAVCIANTSFISELFNKTVIAVNGVFQLDATYNVPYRLYNMALCFKEPKIANLDKEQGYMKESDSMAENSSDSNKSSSILNRFFKNPVDSITSGLKSFFALGISAITHVLLSLCSYFVIIMQTVRYFLMQCGSLLLPIFIAGLGTQVFKSQSIAYIFGFIGIICWPIGWSLGHVGTLALMDAVTNILNGSLITDTKMAHQVITNLAEVADPFEHILKTAGWIAVSSLGSLISLIIMALGLLIWVIIVSLSAPFMVSSMLTTGSQFFSRLAGATGQTMSKAIGGTASYAMVDSMRQSPVVVDAKGNLMRQGPSVGYKTGFAASRTLMNASRYQGDPSQLPHVFDSGFDEMRHYRTENAQRRVAEDMDEMALYQQCVLNQKIEQERKRFNGEL